MKILLLEKQKAVLQMSVFVLIQYFLLFIVRPAAIVVHISLVFFGLVIPFIYLPKKFSMKTLAQEIGFSGDRIFVQLLIGFGAGLLVNLFGNLTAWLLMGKEYQKLAGTVPETSPGILPLILEMLVLVFSEEIFFRSYLDNCFAKLTQKNGLSVTVIALLFGGMHLAKILPLLRLMVQKTGWTPQNIRLFIALIIVCCGIPFCYSMLMGWMKRRIKSCTLLSCLTAHFTMNWIGYWI